MHRFCAVLLVGSLALAVPQAEANTKESDKSIAVMTRNLYLGADVGVALNLLPDFPAAAQFMWDQMKSTDFERRAEKLAQESSLLRPDVIAIQEATTWSCKKNWFAKKKVIFDFLEIFINATKDSGVGYSLVTNGADSTKNPSFQIPALPNLTTVKDPSLFQPLFGQSEAACGFTIADALLVRDDLDVEVIQLGNSEFKDYYSVVPLAMVIYRGYTWADLRIRGQNVRFVATHLESLFADDGVPHSSLQGKQLVQDLASTRLPLIVMGDFNADLRDPRSPSAANAGGQPVSNTSCKTQVENPTKESALSDCNAYWTMVKAGFEDAGPDSSQAKNFTWGAAALLNGPDSLRVEAAKKLGNQYGFTDRLDYIFYKNGLNLARSQLVSETWPQGSSNWICKVNGLNETCLPSDHAGVFAVLTFESEGAVVSVEPPLPDNKLFPIPTPTIILFLILSLILLLTIWLPYRLILKPLVFAPLGRIVRKVRVEKFEENAVDTDKEKGSE